MNKIWLKVLNVFILVSIFILIFWKVGVDSIFEVLKNINLFWLIPFVVIFVGTKMIYTLNLRLLFKAIRRRISYFGLFKYFLLMNSLALFFPSKTGELSLTLLLKKHKNFEYGEVLSVQFIDKLITFSFYGVMAVLGLLFVFDLSQDYTWILLATLLVLVSVFVGAWSNKVRRFIKKYFLRKYSKYFKRFSHSFKHVFKRRKKILVLNFFITAILLSGIFFGGLVAFRMFGAEVSIFHIAMIQSLIIMISLLPIPFSGLGLKEISGIYMYGLIGVPYAVSVNYFLFNILFKYAFGLVVYWTYRKKLEF